MESNFSWVASISNGDGTCSELKQFADGKESMFREVELYEKEGKLKKFRIENEEGEFYEVNLEKGIILADNTLSNPLFSGRKDLKLVYVRRNIIEFAPDNLEQQRKVVIQRLGIRSKDEELVLEVSPIYPKIIFKYMKI